MFRSIAIVLTALALGMMLSAPVLAAPCGTVCAPAVRTVVTQAVVIQPETIAVPAIFFQFLNQVPLAVNAAPAPAKVDLNRIDQLIRERLDLILQEYAEEETKIPQVVVEATPPDNTAVVRLVGSMKNKCSSCHVQSNAKAGVVLFNQAGQLAPNVDAARLLRAITPSNTGRILMPPTAQGNPLSQHAITLEERELLRSVLTRR